jgi:hypothetical protein
MVDQRLLDIIKFRISQRVDLNIVRRQLFLQGYKPADIENAIKTVLATNKKPLSKIKIPQKYILISLTSVILLIFIIFTIIHFSGSKNNSSAPSTTSTVKDSIKITQINKLVQSSQFLEFSYKITSSSDSLNIDLKKEILNSKNEVIPSLTQQESLTVNSDKEIQDSIDVSSLQNDRYSLRLTANLGKKSVRSTELFRILNSNTNNNSINAIVNNFLSNKIVTCSTNSSCNDNNICTGDKCEDNICIFEEISNCCGNSICESSESESSCPADCQLLEVDLSKSDADLMEEANEKALSNSAQSGNICSSITLEYNKDVCFTMIASTSEKSIFCSEIIDSIKKDDCYLMLATSTNNICPKIQDPVRKLTCEYLP